LHSLKEAGKKSGPCCRRLEPAAELEGVRASRTAWKSIRTRVPALAVTAGSALHEGAAEELLIGTDLSQATHPVTGNDATNSSTETHRGVLRNPSRSHSGLYFLYHHQERSAFP